MLMRHTSYYFLARGVPGFVNFAALSAYTHLLSPADYGQFALALATVSLASALAFQWIQMGLLRFMAQYSGDEGRLLSNVLAAYFGGIAGTAGVAMLAYGVLADGQWRAILPVAVILLWVQAWLEINLQLFSSRLQPLRYGAAAGTRALLALVIGGLLAWVGYGATAPLWGLIAGGLIAAFLFSRHAWRVASCAHVDRTLLRELAKYGLPLAGAFALSFVISTSDRYFIASLLDARAVGLYAIAYDLAQCSLGVLMVIVNLAAYPIIVEVLEREGVEAAQVQLEHHWLALLAIAAPAAVGLAILADNISAVLLGVEFRSGAAAVLPWIAGAALLGGVKAFYFDLAFQLGRHTIGQVRIVMIAGLVNVLLNLAWIPLDGLVGAARAALVAYLVGLLLSAWWGRAHFRLPIPVAQSIKIATSVALMAGVLWHVRHHHGVAVLFVQVVLGSASYGVAMWLLNPGDVRGVVHRTLGRR